MLRAYIWNYQHIIWGTKNHERVLFEDVCQKLYPYLLEKSKEVNTTIAALNIQPEHVHVLINLPANLCLSDYMHKVKGASSWWINKNKLLGFEFRWQRGFRATPVNILRIKKVKTLIKNQAAYHEHFSFGEEYEMLKNQQIVTSFKGRS